MGKGGWEAGQQDNKPSVLGIDLDPESRCRHYHGITDIIAIKFRCCHNWYACYSCHEELADHSAVRWRQDEFDQRAIRCGKCGVEFSIQTYLESSFICPECGTGFNPGCAKHYHLYFEVPDTSERSSGV